MIEINSEKSYNKVNIIYNYKEKLKREKNTTKSNERMLKFILLRAINLQNV